MSANKFNSGCLPVFLFWLILVVIRLCFSDGKPWEDEIVTLMSVVYGIGIIYMIFAAIVNKADELPKPKSNLDTRGSSILKPLKQEDLSDNSTGKKFVNEKEQATKPKGDLGNEDSKKYIPLKSSHEYQVKLNFVFKIKIYKPSYRYFAIFEYFPVNRYKASDLKLEDLNNRRTLFDFKDGRNVRRQTKVDFSLRSV